MLSRSAVSILLLICSVQTFAQKFKYGVTANIHKSSIVGIHDKSKGKWGGGAGGFVQWPLVENDIYDSAWLYFSPQLEFSMQGEDAKPPQGEQHFTNYYMAMPLYLKFFYNPGRMKRDMFFFIGPRIEYLVYDKREGPPVYAQYVNQEKKINKFGYGASFGLGLKMNNRFEGFIRYDRGFSKIYPDYTHYNTYNRLLAVGLNFYLKEDF